MQRFKDALKKIIKAISGYQIQGFSRGNFTLIKDNVAMQFLHPETILLTEKTNDEVKSAEGIYDYLRQTRLKMILKKYQINIVLDVGANNGQFAEDLRRIDYNGKIISFEPTSNAFKVLKETSQNDPDWDIHQLALGRQNGEQKIHVAHSTVFTSFLKANDWCEQEFGKDSLGSKEETVIVRRLDEVLKETVSDLTQAKIYLKMDTQGYDLEVFKGLGNMYEKIFALQSEMSVVPIYQDMPHLTDSISFFEKAGFEIAGMYPVNQEKSTLRIVEFDCIMVNSKLQNELSVAA